MFQKIKYQLIIGLLLCYSLLFSCKKEEEPAKNNHEKAVLDGDKTDKEEEQQKEQWEKGYCLPVSREEREEADSDCKKMAELVSDLYRKADKGDAFNVVLAEKTIHQMTKKMKESGAVVRASGTYSDMENYKVFERFLMDSEAGRFGFAVLYEIHADGGVGREKYIFDGTDMYVAVTNISWNDDNTLAISDTSYTRLKDWRYSRKGWFCYNLCVPEYPEVTEMVDGSCLIRVKPMGKKKGSNATEIQAKKGKNGRLGLSMDMEDFIDSFNEYYRQDYGEDYIQPVSEWYSYTQDFGKHLGDTHYEFTADKKILTLPTITVYTSKKEEAVQELTVNFDDHSYTDTMYQKYEELCFYTLRVFFPDFTKKRITRLYKKLNQLAYKNIFPKGKGFDSGNPPSALYYQKEIGVYSYFAYGESVRLCIVPVTYKRIKEYKKQGTVVYQMD